MPVSPSGPIRRSQLIAPFGVGALVVVPGGTSLVVAGLDYWYKSIREDVDPQEYRFSEWRLQALLDVDHFRLPPDFREPAKGQKVPNIALTIPGFRFPTWHFCSDSKCRLLHQSALHHRGTYGRIKCPECEKKKLTRYLFQVPFVAICEHGHLQDFPWREWVHRKINPTCQGDLRLKSTGSSSLAGQKITCSCGASRTLESITTGYPDHSTYLSRNVEEGNLFLCQGYRPWLGKNEKQTCGAPLKGSLRSASNFYYAHVYSSIFLPASADRELQELEIALQKPPLDSTISYVRSLGQNDPIEIIKALRATNGHYIKKYSDAQVAKALTNLSSGSTTNAKNVQKIAEDPSTAFRRAEFLALRSERDDEYLRIKRGDLRTYGPVISKYFDRIMLISKLLETRAFAGLSRIFPDNEQDNLQRQAMLWKEMPSNGRWLPAYKVYGEGLYFELSPILLSSWEKRPDVISRIKLLNDRYLALQSKKNLRIRTIIPRFVLIHTFAHLLMNRLVFECGYSSAALRERLFISDNPDAPMGGVFIYTADGDAEGTMGGLVRMGKPELLEPVFRRTLEGARWCSADPVCMEMGHLYGQGPDACNLAACHNCALMPETACEEFNRFLDRAVVVGDMLHPELGFFVD